MRKVIGQQGYAKQGQCSAQAPLLRRICLGICCVGHRLCWVMVGFGHQSSSLRRVSSNVIIVIAHIIVHIFLSDHLWLLGLDQMLQLLRWEIFGQGIVVRGNLSVASVHATRAAVDGLHE